MTALASFLWYASWPSLTLAVLVLWAFGMVDIYRHRRSGRSTSAGLLCMAGCVSFATVVAVASVGALFVDPWVETVATTVSAERGAGELRVSSRSPIFSFGLENASYAEAGPTGRHGSGAPR
jgi:hypothetical protein